MSERKKPQPQWYKAFDFITGHTYLIGQHESKASAEAYCKAQGMAVIAQTVVALTEEEYIRAYHNRINPEQMDEQPDHALEIRKLKSDIEDKKKQKAVEKRRKREASKAAIKRYQHDYYMRVTKPKRQAKKISPEGRNGGENGTEVLRDQ